jgi:NAD-dependent SIR2 family protein deacetylase
MPRGEAKIFECIQCSKEYTKRDALEGRYFPKTGVCRKCYRKMAKAHPKIYCFGKEASHKLPGYTPDNEICQKLCPDRDVCIQFIQRHKR